MPKQRELSCCKPCSQHAGGTGVGSDVSSGASVVMQADPLSRSLNVATNSTNMGFNSSFQANAGQGMVASAEEAADSQVMAEPDGPGDVVIDELTGVAQADVEKHQALYVRYSGFDHGQLAHEWNRTNSMAAARLDHVLAAAFNGQISIRNLATGITGSQGKSARTTEMPLTCTLKIVQAPAAYARPMVQKKRFRPTFKIRMEVRYRGAVKFKLTVQATPLAGSGFARPEQFNPESGPSKPEQHAPEMADIAQEVENNTITRTIISPAEHKAEKAMDSENLVEEKTMTADFDFTELKFVKSSRMLKRWLVFHCTIQGDLLYCIYDLPSVIVSRPNDQYRKAYELLMGGPPPLKRMRIPLNQSTQAPASPATVARNSRPAEAPSLGVSKMTSRQACVWIEAQYRRSLPGVMRNLSEQEKYWLVKKAGLDLNCSDIVSITARRWNSFEEWYMKCLDALKTVMGTWDQTEPKIICGLYVDRAQAETILETEKPGTFLVRLCSEPGCFAVSTRVRHGKHCDHLLLDRVDLQSHPLLKCIERHEAAQVLIDVESGRLYAKGSIIGTGFLFHEPLSLMTPMERMDNAGGRLGMLPSMANQAWASQSLETPGIGLGMANVMPISQQLGSQSNIYSVGGRDSIDIMDEMLGIENSSSSPQYMGAMPEMQQVPLPPMGSLHAEEQSGWGFQAVSNFVSGVGQGL